MDDETMEIIKKMGARVLGLDDEFKFHCNQCGKCCIHRADILLNPKDVYSISKELRLIPKEFIEGYCESYIGRDSRIPVVCLKPRGSVQRCPLLKDRKCMVHSAKPTVCATYPLGRVMTIEHTDGSDIPDGKTHYILNKVDCGDGTETYTVREWLEAFGIPTEDRFFKKWQETAVMLARTLAEMEDHWSMDTMNLVWSAVFTGLYLDYDTKLAFMPQFEENVRKVRSLLDAGNEKEGGSNDEKK